MDKTETTIEMQTKPEPKPIQVIQLADGYVEIFRNMIGFGFGSGRAPTPEENLRTFNFTLPTPHKLNVSAG